MPDGAQMKVIISNGFNKFHLSVAAASLAREGLLARFITGSYPTPLIRAVLSSPPLDKSDKLKKLLNRREAIPDELVTAFGWSELLPSIGLALQRGAWSRSMANEMNRIGMRQYARACRNTIRSEAEAGATIYHYRAGFGHESVGIAKKAGMYALCDHSIVHPDLVDYLTTHHGQLPTEAQTPKLSRFWRDILADIEQADGVLVNSDFVRTTFEIQKWTQSPIFVTYLGVDQQFLDFATQAGTLRETPEAPEQKSLKILFAGGFDQRKGAYSVIDALSSLADVDWTFKIAGITHSDIKSEKANFFADPRVQQLGWISRSELAREMSSADIFLFPSLAEGSARVVFEALACGCYVITTPNSGSIVRDGEQGRLVPPGNTAEIISALRSAANNRRLVSETGKQNAKLIRQQYDQNAYGRKLAEIYRTVQES